MLRASSSAAGVRFLASIREGCGLKPSARDAGIDNEVGYRWLREMYLHLRRAGKKPAETTALLGFTRPAFQLGRQMSIPMMIDTICASTSTKRPRSRRPSKTAQARRKQ